ncbi:MAG: hypothetical protein K0R90_890, partial [Oscillospiraceae bacterium]|nr:hypothetical protein [Oscillospiraceae bacterium]
GKNYYCESYREFFEYAYERLLKVAKMIQQKNRYGG